MKDRYEYHKGFYKLYMNVGMEFDGDEVANARFRFLATSMVMKTVFSKMYNTLVNYGDMKPVEQMPVEYKAELWGIANEFLPDASEGTKVDYCKSIMATLWLMNNT